MSSKTNDGFRKIHRISNWGYWERYDKEDGEEIIDGTKALVHWPDGTETKETIRYRKGKMTYHDHGHEGQGPDEYSYVEAKVRGIKVELKLEGLKVKVLSVPKQARPYEVHLTK